MRISAIVSTIILGAALSLAAVPAKAQLGNLLGGGTSSVDVDGLLKQQSGLLGKTNSALFNMLSAQSETALALGLKGDADTAQATANAFRSGNVVDQDQISKAVETSTAVQGRISDAEKTSGKASVESKKHIAAAVPFYAQGNLDAAQVAIGIKDWTSNVSKGTAGLKSNPLQAAKLQDGAKSGLYVAQAMPGLVKVWSGATGNFMNYAKGNGVDVSSVSDKLGGL